MTCSLFFFNAGRLRLGGLGTAKVKGPGGRVGKASAFGYVRSGIHTLFIYKEYLEFSRAVFPKVSQGALVLLLQKNIWKTLD